MGCGRGSALCFAPSRRLTSLAGCAKSRPGAIDLTYWETRQLGDNFIGTEHQLLGLIGEGDNLAAQVLLGRGADLERIRQAVRAMCPAGASGST